MICIFNINNALSGKNRVDGIPSLASISPAEKGEYILTLELKRRAKVDYLSYKNFRLERGFYYYFGSARGPGGLAARVSRHLKKDAVIHWHIDKLKARARVADICLLPGTEKNECRLAAYFGKMSGSQIIPKFGCSDCGCPSHLVYSRPGIDVIKGLEDFFSISQV